MRKLMIGIVAAGTMMAAAPASAQLFSFEAPGVGVHVGPGPYHRDRDWNRDRYYDHYAYEDRSCRTVTVRERMPDGRVVVRTRERC